MNRNGGNELEITPSQFATLHGFCSGRVAGLLHCDSQGASGAGGRGRGKESEDPKEPDVVTGGGGEKGGQDVQLKLKFQRNDK